MHELHIHFEGAISLETLRRLSKEQQKELPRHLRREGQELHFETFSEFVSTFSAIVDLLQTEEDFRPAFGDIVRYVRDNELEHCELSWSPYPYMRRGMNPDRVLGVFNECLQEAGLSGKVFFIIDALRDHGLPAAQLVYDWAFSARNRGVVGIGLTGDETRYSTAAFAPFFEQAHRLGLGRTAHAGEYGSSQTIWEAVRLLGCSRIGHGLQAANDPELMEYLALHGIHLEISPTSNLRLERVESYARHPLHEFLRRGISLSINSDDPAIFGTGLLREQALLLENGLSAQDLERTNQYARNAAFAGGA